MVAKDLTEIVKSSVRAEISKNVDEAVSGVLALVGDDVRNIYSVLA
jgi:hypothetical protein